MPHSLSVVYVHLVFSTKERRPFLRDRDMRLELHAYIGGVSKQLDCELIIVGGVARPIWPHDHSGGLGEGAQACVEPLAEETGSRVC